MNELKALSQCLLSMGLIYKITSPNGKSYIGQTTRTFEKRVTEHKNPNSRCPVISRAVSKYGPDNMRYVIIENDIPSLEQLNIREKYWIEYYDTFKNGYNLTSGGDGTPGLIPTDAQIKKTRDTLNSQKIERDGFMGSITVNNGLYLPKYGDNILSYGYFKTREEAVELLKKYTEDPIGFIKPGIASRHRGSGCIQKCFNKWRVTLNSTDLGSYNTEEEAEHAIENYCKDPDNFVKSIVNKRANNSGGVSLNKQTNKWEATSVTNSRDNKGKFLGSYNTKEEAEQGVKNHCKDPDNFMKPGKSKRPRGTGSVSFEKNKNLWRLQYKGKRIGHSKTKFEGEMILETILKLPQIFIWCEIGLPISYKMNASR